MTMLILLITGTVLAYAVSLYFWPMRPCRRCGGRGTNPGSNRRRFGACKRCGGSRSVQRLGSRTVHRAIRGAARSARDRKGK
jgi:DnaJ-class molecular chaperone